VILVTIRLVRIARLPGDPAPTTATPWWANPAVGLAVFALPGVFLAYATPAGRFVQLWGASKQVDRGTVALALMSVGAFAAGCAWWRFVQRPCPRTDTGPLNYGRLYTAFTFLYRLALVSYGLWALVGLHRGVRVAHFRAVLSGVPFASFELKQLLAPVAGVTTFTQTAPLVAALAGMLIRHGHGRLVRRPFALLGALALLRSYFFSERLALLEIGLPLIVAWLLTPSARSPGERPRGPLGTRLFPLAYLAAAGALFTAFEYNRSWAYYRQIQDVSYATFAAQRFLGYYTTPPNNAALVLDSDVGARAAPFTMQWADELPLLGLVVNLYGDRVPFTDLLGEIGNPEFNTEGALFAPAIDWGKGGSVLVWFVGGACLALVFERVRRGEAGFVPLYATLFLGIVESSRYFYWGLGRATVPIVTGVLVARYVGRRPPETLDADGREPTGALALTEW
jgi:hypothetical protein